MKINFLGLPDHPQARVALIPAPLDLTTSWKKGTKEAPLEILKVSSNLEFFDEDTFTEPQKILGFFTFPIPELPFHLEGALDKISQMVTEAIKKNQFPIVIGGEHTVTLGVLKALKKKYPELKILHLDAHCDLRDTYLETSINHATVMRRIYEMGFQFLSVGIRTICKEEYEFLKNSNIPIIWAQEFKLSPQESLAKIEEFIKNSPVYLTLDIDVLDPSIAPGVGTPEPGGLNWEELLQILKLVVKYNLIGMDLVEVMPLSCHQITEYIASKIIFKISAFLASKNVE
ncbi:agmatinase [Candidatus Pacearchaeota archaeon]|nr:MAG: agmatinase [Candidatus Pacearchaeota archaeon]